MKKFMIFIGVLVVTAFSVFMFVTHVGSMGINGQCIGLIGISIEIVLVYITGTTPWFEEDSSEDRDF